MDPGCALPGSFCIIGTYENHVAIDAAGGNGRLRAGTGAAKPNPAFVEIQDDPALPRVLLIGDSISIGYTLPTRALLAGKANVHRILTNGGPTPNGLEHLTEWLGSGKWDVIHFNGACTI